MSSLYACLTFLIDRRLLSVHFDEEYETYFISETILSKTVELFNIIIEKHFFFRYYKINRSIKQKSPKELFERKK